MSTPCPLVEAALTDACGPSFFRYCAMHGADHQQESRPEDQLLEALPASGRSAKSGSNDEEEVELITDYSWRNFFAVINFVHILQKLTKRRVHRILLLVQYKSSVRQSFRLEFGLFLTVDAGNP